MKIKIRKTHSSEAIIEVEMKLTLFKAWRLGWIARNNKLLSQLLWIWSACELISWLSNEHLFWGVSQILWRHLRHNELLWLVLGFTYIFCNNWIRLMKVEKFVQTNNLNPIIFLKKKHTLWELLEMLTGCWWRDEKLFGCKKWRSKRMRLFMVFSRCLLKMWISYVFQRLKRGRRGAVVVCMMVHRRLG